MITDTGENLHKCAQGGDSFGQAWISKRHLLTHSREKPHKCTQCEYALEHKTCDILAAERLRLMRFDNRLIIDSFQKAICILKW